MKKLTPLLISMFILLLLAMTNPTKADYTSWLKEQYISQSTSALDKGFTALIGDGLIDVSTQVKNFVFFSMYTTNVNDTNKVIAIGLFHNFIPTHRISKNADFMVPIVYLVALTLVTLIILLIIYPFLEKQ